MQVQFCTMKAREKGLTFKFAPFAGDQVEGVGVARNDVLASVASCSTENDHLRLGHYAQSETESVSEW